MIHESATLVSWLVGLMLLAVSASRVRDLLAVPPLPILPAVSDDDGAAPSVSVIITARNEEARIETSVRRALGQTGVDVEVVVVDDRSGDRTPEILAALAAEFPRVRVERIDELPRAWLGKPYACHVGACRATGDWLLFSDADTWMSDGVIARSVRTAIASAADHVCLFPGETDSTVPARATLINFSAGLVHYAARANRDHPRSMIGVGAFNLVRAEAYAAIGGHVKLRLEVIDDLKLGLLLRRAGFRSRAYGAARDLEVHWSPTALQLIRALEKNMFAMVEFSLLRALLVVGGLSFVLAIGLAAPFLGGTGGAAAAAGWGSTLVPSLMMAHRARWGWLPALLTPVLSPIMVAAVANSAYRTLRQGGIRWRGTFYPLEMLRRGLVRP